jgi:hypothetical protein
MEEARLSAKLQSCAVYLRLTTLLQFAAGTARPPWMEDMEGWRGDQWNGNRRQVSDPDHVLPVARQKLQLLKSSLHLRFRGNLGVLERN